MIPRLFLFGFAVALYVTSAAKGMAADAGCSNPNTVPQAVHVASLVYPPSAVALHLGARVAVVEVVIDTTGALVETKILQSTGNAALDQAALDAVRATTFAPGTINCTPVKRAGVVRYVFNPPSLPTFTPPVGWIIRESFGAPDAPIVGSGNGAIFGAWRRGSDALFLSERAGNEPLDATKLAGEHGTVLENTSLRSCNDTEDANFIVVRRNGPQSEPGYWAMLVVPTQSDEYTVGYYSPGGTPPDTGVKNAMLSLCAPKG
jgi:TonB family protein